MCRPCADLDRRYEEAVAGVAGSIEAALGPEVFASRVICVSPLRLEPWREARDRMAGAAALARRGARSLLVLDVERCFDRIRHDVVVGELRRIGCAPTAADAVGAVLAEFAGAGVPGLPVGPPASAVLANATLARLDDALRRRGQPHVRWVDDVAVFADGPDVVSDLLGVAGTALRAVGLTVRPDKVRVLRIHDRAGSPAGWTGPTGWLASLAADADAPACLGGPRRGPDARRLDPPRRRADRGHRVG